MTSPFQTQSWRFGKTTEWNRETLKSRVVRIVRHGEQNLGTWKVNFDGLWVLARKRQETTVAGVSPWTSVVHIIHIFVYDMFFYASFNIFYAFCKCSIGAFTMFDDLDIRCRPLAKALSGSSLPEVDRDSCYKGRRKKLSTVSWRCEFCLRIDIQNDYHNFNN